MLADLIEVIIDLSIFKKNHRWFYVVCMGCTNIIRVLYPIGSVTVRPLMNLIWSLEYPKT